MLSLILVQVPHFQSWKWLIMCFSDCKWVRVIHQPSWTHSEQNSCSNLLSTCCGQSSFYSILLYLILKATCKIGIFPHFLKKLILWNLNPNLSGFKSHSFSFFCTIKENKCFSPLLFKYPNPFYKETHLNIRLPNKAKFKVPRNKRCKGLALPSWKQQWKL